MNLRTGFNRIYSRPIGVAKTNDTRDTSASLNCGYNATVQNLLKVLAYIHPTYGYKILLPTVMSIDRAVAGHHERQPEYPEIYISVGYTGGCRCNQSCSGKDHLKLVTDNSGINVYPKVCLEGRDGATGLSRLVYPLFLKNQGI